MSEDDEAYLRAVEARFVALRGRGYAMSARDVGRVLAWRADGVPLRLVVGQLDETFRQRRAASPRPVTLATVTRAVDSNMRRWVERRVPQGVSEPVAQDASQRFGALRQALEEAGRGANDAVRGVLRGAWRRVRDAADGDASAWRVAEEVDAFIGAGLARLVDEAELRALEASLAAKLSAHMSPEARAEKLAFELTRALRERFGVPKLVEVLLDGS